jgi:hypothetical protein
MICPPCKGDRHKDCAETQRRVRLAHGGHLCMSLTDELAMDTGQLCDCQHVRRDQALLSAR